MKVIFIVIDCREERERERGDNVRMCAVNVCAVDDRITNPNGQQLTAKISVPLPTRMERLIGGGWLGCTMPCYGDRRAGRITGEYVLSNLTESTTIMVLFN